VEDQGRVAWVVIALIMERPITIFCDGNQARDILSVDDLLLAIDRIEAARGQVYNMRAGAAIAISIWWEFNRIAEEVLGRPIPDPAFVPASLEDQPVFVGDTAKVRRDFDWALTISALEGIQRLAAWVTKHRALSA